MKKTATKGEKSLACLTFLVSLVALVGVTPVSGQTAAGLADAWLAVAPSSSAWVEPAAPTIAPSYLETRDRVSGKLGPARDQISGELSRDLRLGYDESSGLEAAGSLDASGRGGYRPGDVLPDGRIAGMGPGAAYVGDPAFSAASQPRGGVYVLREPITRRVVRSGRSKDLLRRAGEHGRDPVLGKYEFEPLYWTDVYAEQRGLEHAIHQKFMPELDRIRPISPLNPRRQTYINAGEEFLRRLRGGS